MKRLLAGFWEGFRMAFLCLCVLIISPVLIIGSDIVVTNATESEWAGLVTLILVTAIIGGCCWALLERWD